ncbi:MAG TPA: hypothetical protein VJ583_11240 [Nitrososphaeraceae archaeon]|nr:hypothetical protein [Nitrososphaeraceae archaeon]
MLQLNKIKNDIQILLSNKDKNQDIKLPSNNDDNKSNSLKNNTIESGPLLTDMEFSWIENY